MTANIYGGKDFVKQAGLRARTERVSDPMIAQYLLYSVYMSVRPSQVGVLYHGSRKQRHTISQNTYLSDAKDLGEIPMGSPQQGTKYRLDRLKLAILHKYLAISRNGAY